MKQILITFLLISCINFAWSQENSLIFSGGYAFANIEDNGDNATGFRLNLTYEFNQWNGDFSHGIAVGYISTEVTSNKDGSKANYKLENWPIYYAPKYAFGSGPLTGFVKGALGMHFSNYERNGGILDDISTSDNGFYGGLGAGGKFKINDKFFLNVEYEWAYLGNYYYKDGFMNSIMGGLGIKF